MNFQTVQPRPVVASTPICMLEEITPEENERRFKACLECINSLTHERLVELVGEEWLENYRRQFS